MGALKVLPGGMLASDFLAMHTKKRPKVHGDVKYKIGGVTLSVNSGILLRVDEEENDTIYVESGQQVHFFQDPAKHVSRGTIVFAIYQGKASVAVYRKGVGIKQKH